MKMVLQRFPLEKLCPREARQGTKYHLYAVINHTGSLHSGHCKVKWVRLFNLLAIDYAYVKCEEEWYECNDDRCSKIAVDKKDVIVSIVIISTIIYFTF